MDIKVKAALGHYVIYNEESLEDLEVNAENVFEKVFDKTWH